MNNSGKGISWTNILLIGGLGFIAYKLFQKYQSGTTLQYGTPRVRNLSPNGLTSLSFDVLLPVTNPGAAALTIQSFVGGIFWGTVKLTDLALKGVQTIEPGGVTTDLVFTGKIVWKEVSSGLQTAFAAGDFWRNVRTVGRINAEGLSIDINQPVLE